MKPQEDEYGLSFTDLKHRYFDCQCSDFNHVFRFVVDLNDGEVWLEVQLNSWLPWYKRAWAAVRYVFGATPAYYGHFDTTLLREQDFTRLYALMDQAIRVRAKSALTSHTEKPLLNG